MSSNSIAIHLPDGAVREVPAGTTPLDIANSISPRLAAASVVARLTPLTAATKATRGRGKRESAEAAMYAAEDTSAPRLVDLATPLTEDARLELVTEKDPEALKVVRHSAAHVLATAVLELFPETKLGHGPATDSGFFYDFYREKPFTPTTWPRSRRRWPKWSRATRNLCANTSRASRRWPNSSRDGDFMKTHFVTKFTEPGSKVSFYRNGKFVDFCRGPHVPSTGRVKAVKVTSLAGAYWLGDEKNPQLQRIYGTAFFSQKDLDEHFARLEEAAKRDHRVLGKQLDLFSIQELAGPGLIFWHPKGGIVRKVMEDWMREECLRRGYSAGLHAARDAPRTVEGQRPRGLLRRQHVHAHGTGRRRVPAEADELPRPHPDLQELAQELSRPAAALCRAGQRLPLRALRHHARPAARARLYAGRCAHLLHARARSRDEVVACIDFAEAVLKTFGFNEFKVELSTWDPKDRANYAGSDENWNLAVGSLEQCAEGARAFRYKTIPGEAAFYGPKIDIKLVDVLGRLWQLSTVQFDFTLPARFELEYVGEDGERHQPVMVHRALFGSVERFFGVLIEHYAGAFPLWLAPVQIGLVPISERHLGYAEKVEAELKAAGFRVEVDARNEKMNAKIRDFANQKTPYILVFGDKEEGGRRGECAHSRQRRPGLAAAGGLHCQGEIAGGNAVDRAVASQENRRTVPHPFAFFLAKGLGHH